MSKDYFEGNVDQWTNSELVEEFSQLMYSQVSGSDRIEVRKAILDRMNGKTRYAYA